MLATALSSDARSHYYLASLAERWGVAPLVVIQLLCVILLGRGPDLGVRRQAPPLLRLRAATGHADAVHIGAGALRGRAQL